MIILRGKPGAGSLWDRAVAALASARCFVARPFGRRPLLIVVVVNA